MRRTTRSIGLSAVRTYTMLALGEGATPGGGGGGRAGGSGRPGGHGRARRQRLDRDLRPDVGGLVEGAWRRGLPRSVRAVSAAGRGGGLEAVGVRRRRGRGDAAAARDLRGRGRRAGQAWSRSPGRRRSPATPTPPGSTSGSPRQPDLQPGELLARLLVRLELGVRVLRRGRRRRALHTRAVLDRRRPARPTSAPATADRAATRSTPPTSPHRDRGDRPGRRPAEPAGRLRDHRPRDRP